MPILRKAGGGRRLTPVAEGGCGGPIVPRGRERNKRGGRGQHGGAGALHPAARSRGGGGRLQTGWPQPGRQQHGVTQGVHLQPLPPPPLQSLLASHGPFVGIFRLQPKGKTPVQPVSPQIAPQEQLTSASSRCKDSHVLSLLRNRSQNQRVKPSHSVHGWNKRLFARCGSH